MLGRSAVPFSNSILKILIWSLYKLFVELQSNRESNLPVSNAQLPLPHRQRFLLLSLSVTLLQK